jgi:hypothetical protein
LVSFAFLSLWVVLGCGSGGPTLVPVSGTVQFAGGPPPAKVTLTFVGVGSEANSLPLTGTAQANADGSFTVSTSQIGSGLVPGKYRVNVECWKDPPTMERPGTSHVPVGWQAPELEVQEGMARLTWNIDVPPTK